MSAPPKSQPLKTLFFKAVPLSFASAKELSLRVQSFSEDFLNVQAPKDE